MNFKLRRIIQKNLIRLKYTQLYEIILIYLQSKGYWGQYCLIVPAPVEKWGWLWRNWWNEDWQGKPKYSEKTCPSVTFSTTNPTWLDPGSNPGRRGGKPATNRLSYGAVCVNRCSIILSWTLSIMWGIPDLGDVSGDSSTPTSRLLVVITPTDLFVQHLYFILKCIEI
jgi:hypothetical protein